MSAIDLALPAAVERALRVRLARLDATGFAARLARRDPALWGPDPAHQQVAANRLGWLDVARQLRPQTAALRTFAAEVARDRFTHAIVIGMGGSSLAPEVLARTLGAAPGALALEVLDNTSPAAVGAALAEHDPRRTFFVVSSKSGTTLEVLSLEHRVYEWLVAARADAGRCFAAITDPGTPLVDLAGERGYRRVFLNPPDIGGRYSALSLFGLVPAALIGADLDPLLESALAEAGLAPPDAPSEQHPGILLGVALAELALAGRDKVTLVLPPPLSSLGSWIEQLLAESTGKDGHGLVPVDAEPLGDPGDYGADRVFVAISTGALPDPIARRLEALRSAGHPVIAWSRPTPLALGAEFLRWEIATASAAAVLGVDPFDEPNVSESKQATQALLSGPLAGRGLPSIPPLAARGRHQASAPELVAAALRDQVGDPSDPIQWAAALAGLLEPGDYFALLAFLRATPERDALFARIRESVRRGSRAATTVGYGPRFLHSTGQLHKGGPNHGVFLQLTADEGDEPIPHAGYDFYTLQRAQADGDYRVLERRGRRVLRLDLGTEIEAGLAGLVAAFEGAGRGGTRHPIRG